MKLRKRSWKEWKSDLGDYLDWKGVLIIIFGILFLVAIIKAIRWKESPDFDHETKGVVVSIESKISLRQTRYGNVSELKGWQVKWKYSYKSTERFDSTFVWRLQLNRKQEAFISRLKPALQVPVKYNNEGKSILHIEE